jgi:hypothetical protein
MAGELVRPKKHDVRHKDAKLRFEGSFVAIFLSNTDIIVALAHIELGEDAGVTNTSDSWGNKRHWIEVSLRQCVCFSIVLDWPVRAVLLLKVEEGRGNIGLVRVCVFDVPPG